MKTHEVALWSPTTSSSDPLAVTRALADDARAAGVKFVFGTPYTKGGVHEGGTTGSYVRTNHGTINAGHVVNCAGLYADRVARDFGFGKDVAMLPFKGLYMYCKEVPLKRLIYPVPDLRNPFLGVHFTVTVDGKVKIGPTAIPALWREQYRFVDNFNATELMETLAIELGLFVHANFNFRELALAEVRVNHKGSWVGSMRPMTTVVGGSLASTCGVS